MKFGEEYHANQLKQKLPEFVKKYFPDRIKAGVTLGLQPVPDIHLYSNLDYEIEPNGHILYVYIFSAIGLAILLIACINFANLATALSMRRSKEVGMRKALGAHKHQLLFQILSESVFSSLIAAIIALVITGIMLPTFNLLTNKHLSLTVLFETEYLVALILLIGVIGISSGIYPALLVSKFNVIKILKGESDLGFSTTFFRRILVVVQFTASVILLVGIGIIYQQLKYLNEKELGFQKEGMLVIPARASVNNKYDAFREEMMKHPDIVNLSGVTTIPGKGADAWRFIPEGGSAEQPVMLPLSFVDYEFLNTTGVKIAEGRFLSKDSPSDAAEGFILNQKTVELLGWTDDPIGKKLELFGPGVNTIIMSGYVIGVTNDFHFESLHHEIKPLVMAYFPNWTNYLVKVNINDLDQLSGFMTSTWQKFAPEWPFEFKFLDEDLNQLYANEQKLSTTINYFTFIAIVIACFGLFALGSFTIMNRVKEIGIRKVMGASISSIISLVSRDFIILILVAVLLAWPIAYFIMNQWLSNFAYSIELGSLVFILSGLSALLVGLVTISYHAVKAAKSNPVNSLMYE